MSNDTKWIVGSEAAILVVVLTVGVALGGLIVSQHAGINGRLDRIETDVRAIDGRLRAVEVAFGQVDQRLATLERLHLPAPAAGE